MSGRENGGIRKTHLRRNTHSEIDRDLEVLESAGLVECTVEAVEEIVIKRSLFSGKHSDMENLTGHEKTVAYSMAGGKQSISAICDDTGCRALTVIYALRGLHSKNLIVATDFFTNRKKCSVNLTEAGLNFYTGFVSPLENMLDPESGRMSIPPLDNIFYQKTRSALQSYVAAMQTS